MSNSVIHSLDELCSEDAWALLPRHKTDVSRLATTDYLEMQCLSKAFSHVFSTLLIIERKCHNPFFVNGQCHMKPLKAFS